MATTGNEAATTKGKPDAIDLAVAVH